MEAIPSLVRSLAVMVLLPHSNCAAWFIEDLPVFGRAKNSHEINVLLFANPDVHIGLTHGFRELGYVEEDHNVLVMKIQEK